MLNRIYQRLEWKFLYPMRCFFNPRHKKLRKAIPRTWADSCDLYREVCFALIKEFYEDEIGGAKGLAASIACNENCKVKELWAKESSQNWIDFYKWLGEAYGYITVKRPALERLVDASYPPLSTEELKNIRVMFSQESFDKKKSYYDNVEYFEELIKNRDDEILKGLLKHHRSFWT